MKYNLEDRLIDFAILSIKIQTKAPKSFAGQHLTNQLLRSASSAALNYGEAQAGESRRDFIHKLRISLKELKESLVNLKILKKAQFCNERDLINSAIKECDELISIFVCSIKTANSKT